MFMRYCEYRKRIIYSETPDKNKLWNFYRYETVSIKFELGAESVVEIGIRLSLSLCRPWGPSRKIYDTCI